MINFIICEDEVELMNEYKLEIDKFMMNYDIDYKCYLFQSYDKKFEKAAKDIIGFKIFLLDIRIKSNEGYYEIR